MMMDFARRSLSSPAVYDLYQSLVGSPASHRRFIAETLQPRSGERVLDIGCGVGASLRYVPDDVGYVGIDLSPSYIAKAKAAFGDRGTFVCADVNDLDADNLGLFDRAFAYGVLHHLPDAVVGQVGALVRRVVKPGGTFSTIDPCYEPGQHRIAKLFIDNDRGQFVRHRTDYERLAGRIGPVRSAISHDELRIPFTQIIMTVDVG